MHISFSTTTNFNNSMMIDHDCDPWSCYEDDRPSPAAPEAIPTPFAVFLADYLLPLNSLYYNDLNTHPCLVKHWQVLLHSSILKYSYYCQAINRDIMIFYSKITPNEVARHHQSQDKQLEQPWTLDQNGRHGRQICCFNETFTIFIMFMTPVLRQKLFILEPIVTTANIVHL